MALTATLVGTRGTTGGNSATTGGGTTATSGSTFAAYVSYDASAGTINTSGDNKGNTFTGVGTAQSDGSGGLLRWYVCENGAGGTGHTFTFATANNHYGTVHLFEITSDNGSIPTLDLTVQGTDSTQPWDNLATGVLNDANEVILSGVGGNTGGTGSYTSGNGTLLSEEPDASSYWTSAVARHIVTSSASYSPSFSNASRGGGSIAGLSHITFLEVAGSGAQVDERDGIALSGVTAINGVSLSSISAINSLTV